MLLSELGEFGLIERIAALAGCRHGVFGIGDDAAVLDVGGPQALVVTTDAMVEGTHFRRDWLSFEEIGWRAMAAALSDIAAMGANPLATFASLALPRGLEAEQALAIAGGLAECAQAHGAMLAGGDTASAPVIFIDVTAIGLARSPWLRSGAQPGDAIAVTGSIGDTAAVLALLMAGMAPGLLPTSLRRRFARPRARMTEAVALAELSCVTAAMDISDGLLQDAGHIAARSGVGLRIHTDRLPISDDCHRAAVSLGRDTLDWALSGGEDFELLLTLPEDRLATAAALLQGSCRTPLTAIGAVTDEPGVAVVDESGRPIKPTRTGWDHFGVDSSP